MADEEVSERVLCKIVYFDEGSATDFVQIVHGGGLKTTTELFKSGEDKKARLPLMLKRRPAWALCFTVSWVLRRLLVRMHLFLLRLTRERWLRASSRTLC